MSKHCSGCSGPEENQFIYTSTINYWPSVP